MGFANSDTKAFPWWVGGDLETVEQDFAAFVAKKLADSNRRTETFVPKTHLWAVAEEQFVGRISIHHELNDALRVEGGHIGYDTVPSFRGRGVATEMLRQALPVARALGLTARAPHVRRHERGLHPRHRKKRRLVAGDEGPRSRTDLRSATTGSPCPDGAIVASSLTRCRAARGEKPTHRDVRGAHVHVAHARREIATVSSPRSACSS